MSQDKEDMNYWEFKDRMRGPIGRGHEPEMRESESHMIITQQRIEDNLENTLSNQPPIPQRNIIQNSTPLQTPINNNTPNVRSTEEVFKEMANAMTSMLQTFMERDRKNQDKEKRIEINRRAIPYIYNGLDYEDPDWFILKMEEYMVSAGIREDIEKIHITGEQLKGEAGRWFRSNQYLMNTYHQFIDRFMDRFNSLESKAEAISRLYGEKQPHNENIASFLTRKRRMFTRLIPTTTNENYGIPEIQPLVSNNNCEQSQSTTGNVTTKPKRTTNQQSTTKFNSRDGGVGRELDEFHLSTLFHETQFKEISTQTDEMEIVNTFKPVNDLPRIKVVINKQTYYALLDTGAANNVIKSSINPD